MEQLIKMIKVSYLAIRTLLLCIIPLLHNAFHHICIQLILLPKLYFLLPLATNWYFSLVFLAAVPLFRSVNNKVKSFF